MIPLTPPLSTAYLMSQKKLWAPQNQQLPPILQGVNRRYHLRPPSTSPSTLNCGLDPLASCTLEKWRWIDQASLLKLLSNSRSCETKSHN
jgi:hypothetical protein